MPSLRTFAPDGTYVESLLGHSETGTWELRDTQLTLNIRGQTSVWGILTTDGEAVELIGNDFVPTFPGQASGRWKWRRIPLTTRL